MLLLKSIVYKGFSLSIEREHSVGFEKYMSCIYLFSIIQKNFTALKFPCALYIHPPFFSSDLMTITALFTICVILPLPERHMNGILQYVAFLDQLLLLVFVSSMSFMI